jgi:hypothetical protein
MESNYNFSHEAGSENILEEGPSDGQTENNAAVKKGKRADRSCLLCHRRKIRCDKKSPCSSCARQRVLCCYPGLESTPRRPQKTTISDVAERLAQLERTVRAISSTDFKPHNSNEDDKYTVNTPLENLPVADEGAPLSGVLVQSGDSSRYFNEVLLSRVLEEVLIDFLAKHNKALLTKKSGERIAIGIGEFGQRKPPR